MSFTQQNFNLEGDPPPTEENKKKYPEGLKKRN